VGIEGEFWGLYPRENIYGELGLLERCSLFPVWFGFLWHISYLILENKMGLLSSAMCFPFLTRILQSRNARKLRCGWCFVFANSTDVNNWRLVFHFCSFA